MTFMFVSGGDIVRRNEMPCCLPYNSCTVSLENLVLDQLAILLIDIFLYFHHFSA